jgi:type II secretory pathway component PulK
MRMSAANRLPFCQRGFLRRPAGAWKRGESIGICPPNFGGAGTSLAGSVLIIVLWVAFGLVSLALYFAHSMTFQLRAADNRVASMEAEQAIAGAARYLSNILATVEVPGKLPDLGLYQYAAVSVGDATFWLIGRADEPTSAAQPVFGLVDEASKLNLNAPTLTLEMLQMLPGMTPELAAAIIDWRDSDSTASSGGAEDDIYQRLNPPYRCKNGNFESIDELRLVYGMDLDILFGEDANLNGVLDPNESDGDLSAPNDDSDGWLDSGILNYVTVYSREPNTRTNGEPRINVSSSDQQQLASLLQENFGLDRANEILRQIGVPGGGSTTGNQPPPRGAATPQAQTQAQAIGSVLEFYLQSGMTSEEFAQIEYDVTASTNSVMEGLVNVNTASEAVLACIPGIGVDFAAALVAHRQSIQSNLAYTPSLAWVTEVLGQTNSIQAGPYLTAHTYQCTADIAALGHHGRGYQRVKFIFETSDGLPRILYRQDLTHLGWALGRELRNNLLLANNKR